MEKEVAEASPGKRETHTSCGSVHMTWVLGCRVLGCRTLGQRNALGRLALRTACLQALMNTQNSKPRPLTANAKRKGLR